MREATFADLKDIGEWVNRDIWWRPGQELDFTPVIADPASVTLLEGEGGVFFVWRGPGIYELHLFMGQRGVAAIDVLTKFLTHMRTQYGAKLFWAAIPYGGKESRKVRLFARWMGWKSHGRTNLAHGLCEIVSAE